MMIETIPFRTSSPTIITNSVYGDQNVGNTSFYEQISRISPAPSVSRQSPEPIIAGLIDITAPIDFTQDVSPTMDLNRQSPVPSLSLPSSIPPSNVSRQSPTLTGQSPRNSRQSLAPPLKNLSPFSPRTKPTSSPKASEISKPEPRIASRLGIETLTELDIDVSTTKVERVQIPQTDDTQFQEEAPKTVPKPTGILK